MPISPEDYDLFNGDEDNCLDMELDLDAEMDDELDEDFEEFSNFEPIHKSRDPEGSLTDHLRTVEPNRNGAHKRNRNAQRTMKEYNSRSKWDADSED